MKNSGSSTVATGSGGSTGNFVAHVMQGAFVASHRIERLGGLEARDLVSKVEIMIPETDMDKFKWDLTARDQGHFDIKMMTLLWFNDGVTPQDRDRFQLDPSTDTGAAACYNQRRARTAPDKRPWNKAQAIFLCTMRDIAGLTKEQVDMRWVSTGIRVSVNGAPPGRMAVLSPITSVTIVANWVLNRDRFKSWAPGANVYMLHTLSDGA